MQSILEHFGAANAKFSLHLALTFPNANALMRGHLSCGCIGEREKGREKIEFQIEGGIKSRFGIWV